MEAFAIFCGILVVGYIVGYYGWRIWKSKQNQSEYDFMNSVLKHAPQSIQETFRAFQHNNGRLGKSPSIDPAVVAMVRDTIQNADVICDNVVVVDGYFMYYPYSPRPGQAPEVSYPLCFALSQCYVFGAATVDQKVVSGSHQVHDSSKDKSVVGSAVAGGLIAGGAGAVVGAIAAADNNRKNADAATTVVDFETRPFNAIKVQFFDYEHTLICDTQMSSAEFNRCINQVRKQYPYIEQGAE